MRDHRRYIDTRFKKYAHLVPGLVHLSAVDAFDRYHVENHRFPVYAELLAWDPEERDVAPVKHIREHVLESRGHTRHLHTYVKALLHPQLFLNVFDRYLTHVDRPGRMAHVFRQLQPKRIHISND